MHCIYIYTKLSTIWNALEYHVYYLPPSCTASSSVSCHKTESWLHHQLTRTAALLRCRRGSLDCVIYVVFTINFGGLCFSISSIGLFASKLSDTHIQTLASKCFCTSCLRYMYCVGVVFPIRLRALVGACPWCLLCTSSCLFSFFHPCPILSPQNQFH